MKLLRTVATLIAFLPLGLFAQYESTGEEEAVILSPFQVTGDADTSSSAVASLAGSRVASQVVDTTISGPSVPVTIVKKADAVVIQFVLSNAADKQEARNQELYAAVREIQSSVAKTTGLRMEQREVRFASGNRKLLSSRSQVSYANIVIFAELVPDLRLADRTKQVRDLLDKVKLTGATKLLDGNVGLYLKQPASYRREILQKIFDDLDFMKKGLGTEFEIRPTGLNQQVRIRACSETEVELWIDYSFVIGSVRELVTPKK